MSDERRIEVEVEVPGTPEEAWDAIATGQGITAWFMPAEVEGRVGGSVIHRHGEDMASEGRIVGYDAPHRFAYEEEYEGQTLATEFLVEARSGGTCVVRVVTSGFGDDDAWERAIESFGAGWRQALLSLRLYLTHFAGEPAASIVAGGMASGDAEQVWSELTSVLGIPASARAGERVEATGRGVPRLAGRVEEHAERMLTLLLDEPARGIGFVGVGGPGDEVFAFVRAQLFGPEAKEVAAREQDAWRELLARVPAGTG